MNIIITEWALQSYSDLVGGAYFTPQDYWQKLRPDVEKLKNFPHDPFFSVNNFWGPATGRGGIHVVGGYKMKWHNIGAGSVQLRLSVAILSNNAYLCRAYVKTSDAQDKREAAKLKDHIQDIRSGRYQLRGSIQ